MGDPNPHTAGRGYWLKTPLPPPLSIQGLLSLVRAGVAHVYSDAKDDLSQAYGLLALPLDGLSSQAPYGQLPESSTHKQPRVQTGRSDKEWSWVTARDKLWAGASIQPNNSTLIFSIEPCGSGGELNLSERRFPRLGRCI